MPRPRGGVVGCSLPGAGAQVRCLVRMLYGSRLGDGDYDLAVRSFERAIAIEPTRLIHHVELGRTLLRMGRRAEAAERLEIAIQQPIEDINAKVVREEGRQLLTQVKKSLRR